MPPPVFNNSLFIAFACTLMRWTSESSRRWNGKRGAENVLGQLAGIRTGMRGRQGQAAIKSPVNKGRSWHPGLVSSGQVTPFQVEYRGDWLNVDPSLLYKGGWDERVIRQPKILLRQTGDSLIAAIDRRGLYHLNNLHSISLPMVTKAAPPTLEFLAGVLNSRVLNYYYHIVSLEKGRSMAQTDIETLEKLPICQNYLLNDKISDVVRQIDESYGSREALVALRRQLDLLVYRLYHLDDAEITHLENREPQTGE